MRSLSLLAFVVLALPGCGALIHATLVPPSHLFSPEAEAWLTATMPTYDPGAVIPRRYRVVKNAEGYSCPPQHLPLRLTLATTGHALNNLRYVATSQGADGIADVRCSSEGTSLIKDCFSLVTCQGTLIAWEGNTSNDTRTPVAADVRKHGAVDLGKSNIYVFRRGGLSALHWVIPVALDGKVAGLLSNSNYFAWEVVPGIHRIESFSTNPGMLSVDAIAGKAYFIELDIEMHPPWRAPETTTLEIVEDKYGRTAIKRLDQLRSYF